MASRKSAVAARVKQKVRETLKVRQSTIEEAYAIIYGDREKTYGDPGKNLRAIADFWTVQLKHKYGAEFQLDMNDVCQMMISLKQARLLTSPTHRDSQVDMIGYAALMERVQAQGVRS